MSRKNGAASGTDALVVGATGFLGSAVAATLDADGVAVAGTGRSPGTDHPHASLAFDFFADDPEELLALAAPDVVVLAATVERGDDRPLPAFQGAVDRFVAAVEAHGARLCYVSSDAVFDGEPTATGDATGYRHHDPRSPVSAYGRRLVVFEDRVLAAGADACVVRPSYLYGVAPTGLDPRLAAAREALAEDGTYARFIDMYRSPVAVHEAARAIADLARSDATGVVHLGGPRLDVHEFHRRALDALGVDTAGLVGEPMSGDHPRDRALDCSRLATLLGWRPAGPAAALADVSADGPFEPEP